MWSFNFGGRVEMGRAPWRLDVGAIDVDLVALGLGLEGFSQHQLAHPVDAVVSRLDGEMVHFAIGKDLSDLTLAGARGHKLKLKGRRQPVLVLAVAGGKLQGAELGREFVGCEGRASHGIVIYINGLQGRRRGQLVGVHGEGCASEAEMVVLPFVA